MSYDTRDLEATQPEKTYLTWPQQAQQILNHMSRACGPLAVRTILDATANVGGDTIQFSHNFKKVYSVEIETPAFGRLQANVGRFGIPSRVVYFNVNYLDLLGGDHPTVDVVYIDPPWGGRGYLKHKDLQLKLGDVDIGDVVARIKEQVAPPLIVVKVPINFAVHTFCEQHPETNLKTIYRNSAPSFSILIVDVGCDMLDRIVPNATLPRPSVNPIPFGQQRDIMLRGMTIWSREGTAGSGGDTFLDAIYDKYPPEPARDRLQRIRSYRPRLSSIINARSWIDDGTPDTLVWYDDLDPVARDDLNREILIELEMILRNILVIEQKVYTQKQWETEWKTAWLRLENYTFFNDFARIVDLVVTLCKNTKNAARLARHVGTTAAEVACLKTRLRLSKGLPRESDFAYYANLFHRRLIVIDAQTSNLQGTYGRPHDRMSAILQIRIDDGFLYERLVGNETSFRRLSHLVVLDQIRQTPTANPGGRDDDVDTAAADDLMSDFEWFKDPEFKWSDLEENPIQTTCPVKTDPGIESTGQKPVQECPIQERHDPTSIRQNKEIFIKYLNEQIPDRQRVIITKMQKNMRTPLFDDPIQWSIPSDRDRFLQDDWPYWQLEIFHRSICEDDVSLDKLSRKIVVNLVTGSNQEKSVLPSSDKSDKDRDEVEKFELGGGMINVATGRSVHGHFVVDLRKSIRESIRQGMFDLASYAAVQLHLFIQQKTSGANAIAASVFDHLALACVEDVGIGDPNAVHRFVEYHRMYLNGDHTRGLLINMVSLLVNSAKSQLSVHIENVYFNEAVSETYPELYHKITFIDKSALSHTYELEPNTDPKLKKFSIGIVSGVKTQSDRIFYWVYRLFKMRSNPSTTCTRKDPVLILFEILGIYVEKGGALWGADDEKQPPEMAAVVDWLGRMYTKDRKPVWAITAVLFCRQPADSWTSRHYHPVVFTKTESNGIYIKHQTVPQALKDRPKLKSFIRKEFWTRKDMIGILAKLASTQPEVFGLPKPKNISSSEQIDRFRKILYKKYTTSDQHRVALMSTGDRYLVEFTRRAGVKNRAEPYWGGMVKEEGVGLHLVGQNVMGRLLMETRHVLLHKKSPMVSHSLELVPLPESIKDVVNFHSNARAPYHLLSNFSRVSGGILMDGWKFPSAEHAYQRLKFPDFTSIFAEGGPLSSFDTLDNVNPPPKDTAPSKPSVLQNSNPDVENGVYEDIARQHSTSGQVGQPDAKFVYFYEGDPTYGALTNSHQCIFKIDDMEYFSVDHYMAYHKALDAGDTSMAAAIQDASTPKELREYDEKLQHANRGGSRARESHARNALLEKFKQNPDFMSLLIGTKGSILAETTPGNKVWGTGLSHKDPDVMFPDKWTGQNLLGKLLMMLREGKLEPFGPPASMASTDKDFQLADVVLSVINWTRELAFGDQRPSRVVLTGTPTLPPSYAEALLLYGDEWISVKMYASQTSCKREYTMTRLRFRMSPSYGSDAVREPTQASDIIGNIGLKWYAMYTMRGDAARIQSDSLLADKHTYEYMTQGPFATCADLRLPQTQSEREQLMVESLVAFATRKGSNVPKNVTSDFVLYNYTKSMSSNRFSALYKIFRSNSDWLHHISKHVFTTRPGREWMTEIYQAMTHDTASWTRMGKELRERSRRIGGNLTETETQIRNLLTKMSKRLLSHEDPPTIAAQVQDSGSPGSPRLSPHHHETPPRSGPVRRQRSPGECLSEAKITLRPHQEKGARFFTKPASTHRGLIAAWDVGTGKTILAVAAAECAMASDPTIRRVIVAAPKSLVTNFRKAMAQFGLSEREQAAYTIFTHTRYYKKYMAEDSRGDLANCFLIVDEAHTFRTAIKIFSKKSSGKMAHVFVETARLAARVLLLTATPVYNEPSDINNLVAMVRGVPQLNMKLFKHKIRHRLGQYAHNIFSFVTQQSDPDSFPRKFEHKIILEMNEEQLNVYNAIERGEYVGDRAIRGDPLVFYQGIRQGGNFPDVARKAEWISDKLEPMSRAERRSIVYTNWVGNGVFILEQIFQKSGLRSRSIYGSMKTADRDKAVRDFEDDSQQVDVMFLSKAGGEGLDFTRVRHVFLMAPSWNMASLMQAYGRAIRYRSHASLNPEDRRVDVWHLKVVKSKSAYAGRGLARSADQIVEEIATRKDIVNQEFLTNLMQFSI